VSAVVDEMSKRMSGMVKVTKVNVQSNGAIAARYGVRTIPSVKVIRDGDVVETMPWDASNNSALMEKHLLAHCY